MSTTKQLSEEVRRLSGLVADLRGELASQKGALSETQKERDDWRHAADVARQEQQATADVARAVLDGSYAVSLQSKARAVVEALADLQCRCTLRERDSGHLVGCPVPQQREVIDALEDALPNGENEIGNLPLDQRGESDALAAAVAFGGADKILSEIGAALDAKEGHAVGTKSDAPECDMLEADALDSNDPRAWRTLARKLERKARWLEARQPDQALEAAALVCDDMAQAGISGDVTPTAQSLARKIRALKGCPSQVSKQEPTT